MRRRSRLAIIVAVCLLACAALSAAQAIEPSAGRSRSPVRPAASLPLPPPPAPNLIPVGLNIDRSVQAVKRAKLAFNVQPFRALAWINTTFEPPDEHGIVWDDAIASIYVIDPTGPPNHLGLFAPVNVKMLAFGNIPASATVHISQLPDGRWPKPFKVKLRFSGSQVKPPHPLPCSPPTTRPNECSYTDAPEMTGQANIRVDNVKIDQVPVDVGPNCHTVTPATLSLTAAAGFYSVSISPPYVPEGMYLPFFVGGTLHGPVDVPAFTGCRNGNDDLSSIVTAMVSGPGNELAAHQDGPLEPFPPPRPTRK